MPVEGGETNSQGEMYVVPKGVEHKPYASTDANLLLTGPRGKFNTGTVTELRRMTSGY